MPATIVIGKNFGDEGKGLAADFFALQSSRAGHRAVCVRHNGGAQAGHTVDLREKRFVFSQLSSGSFRGADTWWADSFLPDLIKLPEETERFRSLGVPLPRLYASPQCRCTCPGDVLLNMLLETARGENRHGSCGMGINEAAVRSEHFPLLLGEVAGMTAEQLFRRLLTLKNEYLPLRLAQLQTDLQSGGEYGELLQSEALLHNAAEEMARSAAGLVLREADFLCGYDDVLFEGAQGLLLDSEYTAFAPHLTASRTGLTEPARILKGLPETLPAEVVYVTRTYVTRHGAGPLPHALPPERCPYLCCDRTNVPNPWQGTLRAAAHGNAAEFTEAVRSDLSAAGLSGAAVSLFVTHLNETAGCFVTADGDIPQAQFCGEEALRSFFGKIYLSDSPFAEDVRAYGISRT